MATNSVEFISAKKLLELNQVDLEGKADNLSRYTFWYYTSIETASKILDSCSFYANNLKRMNDKSEERRHKSVDDKVHALCFCNSDTEKIPMWYMYGGITGKGLAIGLTPAVMLEFIKSIDTIQNPEVNGKDKFLRRGIDFDIQIGRIYYEDSFQRINFRRKWYQIGREDIEKFNKDNYFVKDYPWEYEKEFRIVIKTKKSCDTVQLFMPEDMIPKLKIRFAPEIKRANLWEQLKDLAGFRKYYESKFQYSSLNIEMSLIDRNLDQFCRYIKGMKENNPEKYKEIKKYWG